jgi:hypothetical protein
MRLLERGSRKASRDRGLPSPFAGANQYGDIVAKKPHVSVPWPASSLRNYCPQQDPDETAGHEYTIERWQ